MNTADENPICSDKAALAVSIQETEITNINQSGRHICKQPVELAIGPISETDQFR